LFSAATAGDDFIRESIEWVVPVGVEQRVRAVRGRELRFGDGLASHRYCGALASLSTPHATATGIPSAASWLTSG
jgi:hypothetical protein